MDNNIKTVFVLSVVFAICALIEHIREKDEAERQKNDAITIVGFICIMIFFLITGLWYPTIRKNIEKEATEQTYIIEKERENI